MQNFYEKFYIVRMNIHEDQKVESSETKNKDSKNSKGCAKDSTLEMLRAQEIRLVKMEDNSSKTPIPFPLLILVQLSLLSL